jgi:hypothetical protein
MPVGDAREAAPCDRRPLSPHLRRPRKPLESLVPGRGHEGRVHTGLRLGELLGLTWERVDMSRGVIRLELTKSGRRRKVPLNDDSDRALVRL